MKIFKSVPRIFTKDRKIPTTTSRLNIGHYWKTSDFGDTMESIFDFVAKIQETKGAPDIQKVFKELQKETGLQKVLNDEDLGRGFVFANGKSNLLFFHHKDQQKYFLGEQSHLNGKMEQYITINSNRGEVINSLSDYSKFPNAEMFIDSILDRIDLPFLKLRKFANSSSGADCLSNANRAQIQIAAKIPKTQSINISNSGVLDENQLETTKNIKNIFADIYNTLDSISNITTRHKVKNAYHLIKPGLRGTRLLEFDNLQGSAKELMINYVSDHDTKCLVMCFTNPDGKKHNIIINDAGKVMKEKVIRSLANAGSKTSYYTQEEINNPEFSQELHFVKKQMENYLDFLKNRAQEIEKKKDRLSTSEIGRIKPEILKLAEETFDSFKKTKSALAEMKDMTIYKRAKELLNYDSKKGSPSLILKNITDKNEDLYVSFPVVLGKKCTKIIVCEGSENIIKSFFVIDDKLVKFEAKKLGRSARKDNAFNYYSQEEIDNSKLDEYLQIIKTRLEYMKNQLDTNPELKR